jgi:type IV pilus assembly protein PilM
MLSFLSKIENLVGLDIGSHAVKLVQLKAKDNAVRLSNLGLAPLPREAFTEGRITKPELVANSIRQLTSHLKLKEKAAAISISGYEVMIKKIELPTMSEEELANRMQSELGQYIPYNIEEVDVDYQVMDMAQNRPNFMEVLLVAAKKESVSEYTALLRMAGLDTYVVDVDFFALGNAFETTYGFGEENVALLDIGATKSVMNIANKGAPVFTRGISIGGGQITDNIKDAFRLSPEDAERVKLGEAVESVPQEDLEDIFVSTIRNWVNEFRRAIDFYYNNYPDKRIEKIFLSGGSCRIPGLDRVFQENMEIPVEIFNPLSRIQYDSKQFDPSYIDYIGPQMAISLGLALRKTKEK